MIRSLACLFLCVLPHAATVTVEPPSTASRPLAEDKAIKALDAWLKFYRSGKLDFAGKPNSTKDSTAAKMGLLPKGFVGDLSYERELDMLCELVAKLDTADAADALLEVAAVGIDGAKYAPEQLPFQVRAIAQRHLVKMSGDAAKTQIGKHARGEIKLDKSKAVGVRAAAVRTLGLRKEPFARVDIEKQLAAPDLQVRLAAADAITLLADEASVPALNLALETEPSDVVLEAILEAYRQIYDKFLHAQRDAAEAREKKRAADEKAAEKPADKPAEKPADKPAAAESGDKTEKPKPPSLELPETARLAVRAATKALGRTTWRGDLALVRFLDDFRLPTSVPALIDILQRFKDHPDEIANGKLSVLLQHRTHEVLVGYTGAVIPADAPEKWREMWEKEKDNLQVAVKGAKLGKGDTVASMLFGIPVEGSRVLFIIDLSGSMDFPMKPLSTTAGKDRDDAKKSTRISVAKKQLCRVIGELNERGTFNIITFNGNPKPEVYAKEMQPASPKNKERAIKFIEEMRANGGTNTWAGLDEGLKMKSQLYGDRYETNVDEMFVVSDGAPSVGEIVDPVEILNLVTETNRVNRVRINTIFITSPNEQNPMKQSIEPDEFMRRLATQNGGKFTQLKS